LPSKPVFGQALQALNARKQGIKRLTDKAALNEETHSMALSFYRLKNLSAWSKIQALLV